MDIKEIITRNYAATVRRGKITIHTTQDEFIDKIKEELQELESEVDLPFFNDRAGRDIELADIVLVCFAYAEHFGIDLLSEMEKKVIFNEKRSD